MTSMTSMTSMTPAPRTEPPARRAHRSAPAAGADPRRLPRLLPDGFAAEPACLADHLARYGPPPPPAGRRSRREELIAEAELAGLAGRGGAGFPTARKLAAVAARRHAVVVGNGSEGEPASAKDKVLMAQSPHLVLDGAAVAADMVGAAEAIIVAHPAVSDIIAAAAAERSRARLDRVRISVVPAAGRFVAGEASVVVHWIERGIAKPRATARRLSERGLHGRPTLVQNVETLAHLALVASTAPPGSARWEPRRSRDPCWSRWRGRSPTRACTRSPSEPRSARFSPAEAGRPPRSARC